MVQIYEFFGADENVVLENEFLYLQFMPDTTEIILTDKTSGVQWRSNPANPSADDVITMQLMESQFSVRYSDNAGVGNTLQSGFYSVQRDTYTFDVTDNVLQVHYTVGDDRYYRIPPAMHEDRMESYLDRMEWDERDIVEMTYRLYDINSLRMNDNRAQLLADFPELARMKLWVLRLDAPEYMKEITEESFKNAGYTNEDYIEDSLRYQLTGGAVRPAFSLTLRYSLDGRSLLVNVPFDQIGYRSAYPITELALLPFMGSGSVNDSGYMLVPDGSGSIINFNNGKNNQNPLEIDVYGWDEAMPRRAIVNDDKALFPAFGIQKNGAALFCVIEEGSAYASIRADVSGRNSAWNYVYPVFFMVHGALMDISGRNQRDVYMYEANLPEGESITLRYTPCAAPGYMGMAAEYRSWLFERYPAIQRRNNPDGVPVAVEVVGAVNKTQHRLGLPMELPLRLTSYNETQEIIRDLSNFGWSDVHIKLNGWFNKSVDHSVPSRIRLIKELGSKNDFLNMVSLAGRTGFNLYPEVDFVFMRDVGTFSGFNLYSDAARYVNRERAQSFPYSFVWFGERKQWGKLSYLARPSTTTRMIDNFMPKAEKLGVRNVAFRSMGSRLGGDYHERRYVSREASMRMRQQQFEKMDQNGNRMLVNGGFVYSAPWASIITDMIIEDQGYGLTDSSVPFLPIVLHGYVQYTGRPINLAEDYTKNLLKTIESGAGLYFSFMFEETAVLQETRYRQFYANEYRQWIGDANALYQQFCVDFGHLYNQRIVNHVILSQDVTVTEYEDGTRVVVNSSNNVWRYNNVNINADSYIVLRRGE